MIKTVTTTSGVNTVSFDTFYKYFWVKNKGDTAVTVSACCTIAAGEDETAEIAEGETVMIENDADNSLYVLGAGKVEIHAQDYADCPFKIAPVGGGGGGTAGKSAYEIAVDNGFVGTETEWLESLKGADGVDGVGGVDIDFIAEPYEFNGKNSAWFGDSITKGFLTSTTNVNKPFVNVFCDLVKLSYTNYGLTSSLWTSGYREINNFLDTIKETDLSNYDYVFINGGINDYHSSVTIDDFTEAVDETLLYLKNNFNGKVIVISPFNSVETTLSFEPSYNIQLYRNIIRQKCVDYDFSYVAGISLISPSSTSFASTTYFVDNYHLNQSGHYLAGTRLAERFLNCDISNIYTEEEQIIGLWIDGRPIYRKVVHIGQFPTTTGTFYTKHDIIDLDKVIKVYGFGITGVNTYPFPWASNTENANISIFTGQTSVGIITSKDQSMFTDSYAIVEYVKISD